MMPEMRGMRKTGERLIALLLAVWMILPMFPAFPPGDGRRNILTASAAASDEAVAKIMEWGVANGYSDGQFHPERLVTRAQFCAMINRAYGYREMFSGDLPFRDVQPTAWYYDDISIAYQMGYFTGVSNNAANPEGYLSRQQAMTLLAKNLRLDSVPGEVTEFIDGNRFANYAKGYVKAAVEHGLIAGYADGTFRPEENITRGAMAILLYRALGNLVNESGVYDLGDTFGNVTVSVPNTTLRNGAIAGNLYITGGLGLGNVGMENVRVLGDIIVAGTGVSETGAESVVLRNVEADQLQIDSLTGQYLSLRSEGTTSIKNTTVRSDAYIQDRTPTGQGLLNINLEGEQDNTFTLSGNIETVSDKTPGSSLIVADGTIQNLTIHEEGAGSSLRVDNNTTVKQLNLDTAVPVTGDGDIASVNINTDGTNAAMLPDTVAIRPGIVSRVSGQTMTATQAQETSDDPRLLAGYPRAINIAPTTCTALFSTNKAGTVYWAVTSVTDGSVTDDLLINPPVYGSPTLAHGNTRIASSNTEARVAVARLTAGGAYYLSAVLVDARGTRSPVKVASFSTPDGTVPAFNAGYPAISADTYDRNSVAIDRYSAQVIVMANKNCMLYWALYNQGSATPTGGDFRSGSLSGSIASGVQPLTRSYPSLVQLTGLTELTDYDVYLWLTDADFAQSSSVRKLTFKTVDGTPPVFLADLSVTAVRATSLALTTTVNENATIFWVAVLAGADYPKPQTGSSVVTEEYARLQISSGMNGVKSGSVNARANTPVNINVSGLQAQTAYDIWYIARDAAGNYSYYPPGDLDNPNDPNNPRRVCMITANTLDNIPPTAVQEFTRYPEGAPESPYADSGIRIVFSEGVQRASTDERLIDLYRNITAAGTTTDRAAAREALADCLRNTIKLYDRTNPGLPVQVQERTRDNENIIENWVIDYRNAQVLTEDTRTVVYFPTIIERAGERTSALRLSSGVSYYFTIEDIADISSAQNQMPVTRLDRFRTISAQVALQALSLPNTSYPEGVSDIDMTFSMTPLSTSTADRTTTWDMLIWSDTSCKYELYTRSRPAEATSYDRPWRRVENPGDPANTGVGSVTIPSRRQIFGQSLHFNLYRYGVGETPNLTDLEDGRVYEYAIHFLEVNGDPERTGWSQEVHFNISVVAGSSIELGNLAANITEERFAEAKAQETVQELSTPDNLGFRLTRAFLDTVAPSFSSGRPIFDPGDTTVEMRLQLNRSGMIFYALAPADGTITTRDMEGLVVDWNRKDDIPTSGSDIKLDASGNEIRDEEGNSIPLAPFYVSVPPYLEIVNPEYDNPEIITGNTAITSGSVTITARGLIPETDYFAYFVTRGTGQTYSPNVQIFRFTTTEVQRPVITLDLANPIVNVGVNRESEVDFMVANYNSAALSNLLSREFWNNDPTGDADPPAAYRNYATIGNVLQAMATNLSSTDSGGEGSVFDKYATQTFKDQVAEYIRASSSNTAGTIIGVGHGVEIQPGARYVVDASNYPMSERAQYAFLAVGRSPSGSGDAFRAIYPLSLVDSDAPKVTAVESTLNMDVVDGEVGSTCSGRVSLTFNEYLYHSDDSTSPPTLQQVDRGTIIATSRQPGGEYENFISIGSLIQSESNTSEVGLMLLDSEVGHQTLTIDFAFDHAQNGAFITFTTDICDQYSNVRSSPLTVRVNIQRVRTIVDVSPETGDPIYGYISTPLIEITSDWDARTTQAT